MPERDTAHPDAARLPMLGGAAERLPPDEQEYLLAEARHVARRREVLDGEAAWTPDDSSGTAAATRT